MDNRSETKHSVLPGGYFIPYPLLQQTDIKESGLTGFLRVLGAEKKLIFLLTIVSIAVAVAVAFLLTPIYRAEILLAPVSDDQSAASSGFANQLSGIASFTGISLGGNVGGKDEFIATLQSRVLIDVYVRENNLLPIIFEDDWDNGAGKWKDNDLSNVPTLWDAYKLIEKKVRQVTVDKKTGLVTLAIEWKEPELAARWADGLVKRANLYLRQKAVEHVESNLAYLQEQAHKSNSVELQRVIYRLMEAEVKKAMLANVNEEFAFKIIDPAVVPEEKVRPRRAIIIVVGGVLGFSVAYAVALVLVRQKTKPETDVQCQ